MSDDHVNDSDQPEEITSSATEGSSPPEQSGADPVPFGRTPGWGRRELFKALASVPIFGALAYGVYRRKSAADEKRRKIFEELGVSGDAPAVIPEAISSPPSERLRLGVVGYGGRGTAQSARSGARHLHGTARPEPRAHGDV